MTGNADDALRHDCELAGLRKAIEHHLDSLLPLTAERDPVTQAMREAALAPGKRIRPLLMLLACRDLGCADRHPGLLDLACAVEMVHAASLMLDDIPCMDNAAMRRGRPTIHRQFGESVAILAAVALLSKAFGVVSQADGLTDTGRALAVAELSTAVGMQGLVKGQYQDLSDGVHARSSEAIDTTNNLKTGMLFSASLQMAAIAANASDAVRARFRSFALDFGQAFQLLDDLADGLTTTGKDSNKDVGKSTLASVIGHDGVRQRLREHLERADEHLSSACIKGAATQQFMHSWFNQQLAVHPASATVPPAFQR